MAALFTSSSGKFSLPPEDEKGENDVLAALEDPLVSQGAQGQQAA